MSQLNKVVQNAQNLKLKEAVPFVQKHAREHWTPSKLQDRFVSWRDNYKKQYIDTGSPKPITDILTYGFFLSYAISWPNVRPVMNSRSTAEFLTCRDLGAVKRLQAGHLSWPFVCTCRSTGT